MSMSGPEQQLRDHRFLLFKFVHRGVDFGAAEGVDREAWNDVQFLAVASNWKGGDEALLHAVTAVPAFEASCPFARFSSSRVMACHRSRGTSGALLMAIRQFVLQGLPTTRTRTSGEAFF